MNITAPLTIDASGLPGGVTIDALSGSRVFDINNGNSTDMDVTLSGMTITGGRVLDHGGGIRNFENLTMTSCAVTNSEAFGYVGGGIYSDGDLSLTNSTISGNSSSYGGGVHISNGNLAMQGSTLAFNYAVTDAGGIFSDNSGFRTTITNSTISGNIAGDDGGGIFNASGLTQILNATITKNYAVFGRGSGVASSADTFTLTEVSSSIISGNTNNSDVDLVNGYVVNSFSSDGYNLIGGGNALSAFNPSDQINVYDPGLLPLANNGGPTQTHALLGSSPAVDRGMNPWGLTNDQRGAPFLRQDIGFPVDVGAVEWQSAYFPLVVDTTFDEFDDDYTAGDLQSARSH